MVIVSAVIAEGHSCLTLYFRDRNGLVVFKSL